MTVTPAPPGTPATRGVAQPGRGVSAGGRSAARQGHGPHRSWRLQGRARELLTHSLPVRLAVVMVASLWSLPTAGLLVSSFRHPNAIRASGWWQALLHPFEAAQWTVRNYAAVLTADGMFDALVNSLVVTLPATLIPITLAAFAAYAFAWMRFPGKGVLFAVVVGLIVVPLQMTLVPLLRAYVALDLTGSFLGMWLAHTGFGLPLAIYLLYTYMASLPRELFESAFVDGASHFTAFMRLALPLSLPAIAAFAIFQFLWVWNDLLIALVFLGTESQVAVLTARLATMVGSRGEAWHVLTAGAFVTMAVPLAVFLLLQRFFVRGLLAGGIKG